MASPQPQSKRFWVKNLDTLLLLMSSDTLEPAGALSCIGEALRER